MLGLAVWLAAGVFFASILASIFGVVGHGQVTAAPQLILGMFGGSTFLIGWLCWHSYRKSAIRLTNRRAILQTGPLFKGAGEMDLGEAKLVTLREPLLGRLFNYGTVCIVGMRGARFPLRFIPNPREFYQTISQLVDE